MKTIAVAGGAGIFGSDLCRELKASGFDPFVVDNLSTGKTENIKYGSMIKADLLEVSRIAHRFKELSPRALVIAIMKESGNDNSISVLENYKNSISQTMAAVQLGETASVPSLVILAYNDSCGDMIKQILDDCSKASKLKMNVITINETNSHSNAIEKVLQLV